MTGRSVPLWIGATPDAKVPARVRQRVYERHGGRCHLSGIPIAGKAWELEHVKPLHLGGRHAEDNLAPALVEAHRKKTAAEMKAKAKADRAAMDQSRARPAPKRPIRSAPFPKSGKRAANPMPGLPRREMYQ